MFHKITPKTPGATHLWRTAQGAIQFAPPQYEASASNPILLYLNAAGPASQPTSGWPGALRTGAFALYANGAYGSYTAKFVGGNATVTGLSYGVNIAAGTTSADVALLVTNRLQNTTFLELFGDGHGTLGPAATLGLSWTTAGAATLTVTGGQKGLVIQPSAASSIYGLAINSLSTSDYAALSLNSGNTFESTDFEIYQQGSNAFINNGAAGTLTISNNGQVLQVSSSRNITISAPASGSPLTVDANDDSNVIICNDTGTVTDGITALIVQHGGTNKGWLGTGLASATGAAVSDFSLVASGGELGAGQNGATTAVGNIPITYWELLTSTHTLTSQTAAQAIFNSTTNGAITLPVGTYEFEVLCVLSGMSATSGSFGFAIGGTATINQDWWSLANKIGANGTPETAQMLYATAANTTLATASTATSGFFWIRGTIRVSVTGTVIPQVSLGVASAATVGVGSYCFFRYMTISGGGRSSFGPWS